VHSSSRHGILRTAGSSALVVVPQLDYPWQERVFREAISFSRDWMSKGKPMATHEKSVPKWVRFEYRKASVRLALRGRRLQLWLRRRAVKPFKVDSLEWSKFLRRPRGGIDHAEPGRVRRVARHYLVVEFLYAKSPGSAAGNRLAESLSPLQRNT
jgi:hypothetical protein